MKKIKTQVQWRAWTYAQYAGETEREREREKTQKTLFQNNALTQCTCVCVQ